MKLTEEQKQFLNEKLNSLGIPPKCNICSSDEWSASDTIFEVREFQGGSLIIGGNQSIYPVIPISCNKCGNTVFINALRIGVLSPQPPKSEGKNE
jgi:hypothetical protein